MSRLVLYARKSRRTCDVTCTSPKTRRHRLTDTLCAATQLREMWAEGAGIVH